MLFDQSGLNYADGSKAAIKVILFLEVSSRQAGKVLFLERSGCLLHLCLKEEGGVSI